MSPNSRVRQRAVPVSPWWIVSGTLVQSVVPNGMLLVSMKRSQPLARNMADRPAAAVKTPLSPVFRLFTFNDTHCGGVAEPRSNRFVCDSALEGTGFEPSVPPRTERPWEGPQVDPRDLGPDLSWFH